MDIKIITGMSGAGKSTMRKYFEDRGYCCHDNFPAYLIIPYIDGNKFDKVVFIVDSRTESEFNTLVNTITNLKTFKINFSVIYMDCNDSVLIHRYRENKKLHHFQILNNMELSEAISEERKMVEILKPKSDYIFDTSSLEHSALLDKARSIFEENKKSSLMITCMSFGYKHGIPKNVDILYDVRCFKNPYWVPELRDKTGKDKEVIDYILEQEESTKFFDKICDIVDFTIPLYMSSGRKQLTIAFGCTGGHHRSVCFAEMLYNYLLNKETNVIIKHVNIKD